MKEKVTPFQYVDEVPDRFRSIEKIPSKHTSKYKDKNDMSTYEKLEDIDDNIVAFVSPLYRSKLKKEYSRKLEEYENESNEWAQCLAKCEEKNTYYEISLEIAKLYRIILMTIRDTVLHAILPELNGIKSFLYAEAVKDCVLYEDTLTNVRPVDIKQYKGSSAYGSHYVFVENAHDFYMMIVSYFTTAHLTKLLTQNAVTEQEKQAFDQKIIELKNQKKLLEGNMIFTEAKDA